MELHRLETFEMVLLRKVEPLAPGSIFAILFVQTDALQNGKWQLKKREQVFPHSPSVMNFNGMRKQKLFFKCLPPWCSLMTSVLSAGTRYDRWCNCSFFTFFWQSNAESAL